MFPMKTADPFIAYFQGRDSAPEDRNPFPPGSPCWNGWRDGYLIEHGRMPRMPVGEELVARWWPRPPPRYQSSQE